MLGRIQNKIIPKIQSGIKIAKKVQAFRNNCTDVFDKKPLVCPILKYGDINVTENIPKSYAEKIVEAHSLLPKKISSAVKNAGYEIYITENLEEVCKQSGIKTEGNVYGLTVSNKAGQNAIYFSDKIPEKNMSSVINHETGHAICNILKLSSSEEYKKLIKEDVTDIIKQRKLDNLKQEERLLLSKYFFNPEAKLPEDELIADLIAWHLPKGGCYGSALTLSEENKDLMFSMFPKSSKKIKSIII